MEFEIGGKIQVVDLAEIDRLLAMIAEGPGDDPTVKLADAPPNNGPHSHYAVAERSDRC